MTITTDLNTFINTTRQDIIDNSIVKNGKFLECIPLPDLNTILNAVSLNGLALQFVDLANQTVAVIEAAIRNAVDAVKYVFDISKLSDDIRNFIISRSGLLIQYLPDASDALKLLAVQVSGLALKYIINPTKQMILAAVSQNSRALKYVQTVTQEILDAAGSTVRKVFGFAVNTFKKIVAPTTSVILAELARYGKALRYVLSQTDAMIQTALQQTGLAIKYVLGPVAKWVGLALATTIAAIQFISNPPLDFIFKALQKSGLFLKNILNAPGEWISAALNQTASALRYIKDLTLEQLQLAMSIFPSCLNYNRLTDEIITKNFNKITAPTYNINFDPDLDFSSPATRLLGFGSLNLPNLNFYPTAKSFAAKYTKIPTFVNHVAQWRPVI